MGCVQTPPPQPTAGPGGSDYVHAAAQVSMYGSGDEVYWIYEPDQPQPASAPVILYLHGYGALNDDNYEPWLTHLARKGYSVIYPRYGWLWNPWDYEDNALEAYHNALQVLSSPGRVAPELDKTAITGHSLGGILTMRLANRVAQENLPIPKALVLHDAAGFLTPAYPFMPLNNLSNIDPNTILVLACAQTSIFEANANQIWTRSWTNTPQIPRDRKNGLLIRSDTYGVPDLISDHGAVSSNPVDAIDWFGYWKVTEAAFLFSFYGTHEAYVLGDGPEVRNMGQWSDGVPVVGILPASDLGY